MMSDAGSPGLSDIFPEKPEHLGPAEKKTFKPWHKPRKHYIRLNQWKCEAEKLIDQLALRDRPLRYFSLPGEDLIDIRVLHNLCNQKGVSLRCFGLNDSLPINITEVNISRMEVANLPLIWPDSIVLKDDFKMFHDEESKAYNSATGYGPFDIINLDLCDSISRHEDTCYFQAVCKLINYQISKGATPWLFFLTTRTDPDLMHREDLSALVGSIKTNEVNDMAFADNLKSMFGFKLNEISLDELVKKETSIISKIFGIGFGKWLLQLLLSGTPQWVVTMLDSYWYRVERQKKPNMLSLAFKLEPYIEERTDPSGLIQNPVSHRRLDEKPYANIIAEKINKIIDVDLILQNNKVKLNEMIESFKLILDSARYDTDDYAAWAISKLPVFD
jgi:hypothetical protein